MKQHPALILAAAVLALFLLWAWQSKRLIRAADGRWFWQTQAKEIVPDGTPGDMAIYVPLPPDGRNYTTNLAFEMGQISAPVMTSLA